MSTPIERLRANRVKVHRVETRHSGEQFFRDPSGADWLRINQLFEASKRAGQSTVQRFLIVPLLLCQDADGELAFPDYEIGVRELQSLSKDALLEITNACFDVTGLGQLLHRGEETAEKNSSASPN